MDGGLSGPREEMCRQAASPRAAAGTQWFGPAIRRSAQLPRGLEGTLRGSLAACGQERDLRPRLVRHHIGAAEEPPAVAARHRLAIRSGRWAGRSRLERKYCSREYSASLTMSDHTCWHMNSSAQPAPGGRRRPVLHRRVAEGARRWKRLSGTAARRASGTRSRM